MKKNLTYFIAVFIVCIYSFTNCSNDDVIVAEAPYENGSKLTKAKEIQPNIPDECNPLGPGVDSHFAHSPGGGASFHWLCSCGSLNAFYHETCISCKKSNPSPNTTHKDPESPIKNPEFPMKNPDYPVNNIKWYTNVGAQKYYIDIYNTNRYQNDSSYADGVNYAWFMMVKIMKLNDPEVTILKCKRFVNYYLPLVDGSYKEGYIDGANAAIRSYNDYANGLISPFQISKELYTIL